MTEINFDSLKRPVQDSLLDSLRGQFAPRPILVRLGARRSVEAWIAVSGAAALALAVLYFVGFGEVDSALALHPIWMIAAYVLLVGVAALGVVNAMVYRARVKALPFAAGIYVFPANLIDARDRTLRVYAMPELSSVTAGRSEVVLAFGAQRFSFPTPDPDKAQEAVRAVEAARDEMGAPLSERERNRLDPLAAPVAANPFTSDRPLARIAPRWEKLRIVEAAVIGAVVGGGLFFLRNATSDSRMLAWSRVRDDVASYQAYLARGRRHREAVSQVHLPRAALRGAVSKGSVDAIDAFTKEYPSTGIQAEVANARRGALVGEFERARSTATFDSLLSFSERYPDHAMGPAFDQARRSLYARSLERYKQQMPEPVVDFVRRLVAFSEKAGPKKTPEGFRGPAVQVRFRRVPSKEMDRADDLVRQNPMFNGTPSLPTRYFDGPRFEPHEKAAADGLVSGLSKAIDPEIVTFEHGPPLDGASEVPALPAPTLVISYRAEPSGAAYATKRPRGIFLGIVYFFSAEFVLPGDANALKTKLNSSQRVPTAMLKPDASGPPGTLESAIYDAMTHAAFDELRDEYLSRWSKKSDPPKGDPK